MIDGYPWADHDRLQRSRPRHRPTARLYDPPRPPRGRGHRPRSL